MSKSKWYTVRVSPIDEVREPYKFKIETSNLQLTMGKYTHNKDGEVISTWEIISR
mgnify:CR=1 FL=1|tara:strand:+ start:707 stop:871 length:165 start_codon:yes stop_codon:yes gene_type:complete